MAPKRKRGRPKKKLFKIKVDGKNDNNDDNGSDNASVFSTASSTSSILEESASNKENKSDPMPKKRGRPRKDSLKKVSLENVESNIPRKRGRPKKMIIQNESDEVSTSAGLNKIRVVESIVIQEATINTHCQIPMEVRNINKNKGKQIVGFLKTCGSDTFNNFKEKTVEKLIVQHLKITDLPPVDISTGIKPSGSGLRKVITQVEKIIVPIPEYDSDGEEIVSPPNPFTVRVKNRGRSLTINEDSGITSEKVIDRNSSSKNDEFQREYLLPLNSNRNANKNDDLDDNERIDEILNEKMDALENEFQSNNSNRINNNIGNNAVIKNVGIVDDEEEYCTMIEQIEEFRAAYPGIKNYLGAAARVNINYLNMGEPNRTCRYCQAMYFLVESTGKDNIYTKCCNNGKIILEPLLEAPELLRNMNQSRTEQAKDFQCNILRINCLFQFSSIEAPLRKYEGRGPYVYSIQGQMRHHISNINVNNLNDNNRIRYGSYYLLDPEAATNARYEFSNEGINKGTLKAIDRLLREINPYARIYVMAYDYYKEQKEHQNLENDSRFSVAIELQTLRGRDVRQYHAPVSNEVACVYIPDAHLPRAQRLRVILQNEGRPYFRELSYLSEHIGPLTFPLLFPRGEVSWSVNMRIPGTNKNISLREFTNYRLMKRQGFHLIKDSGRLSQQYIVYEYVRIESQRIQYFIDNQGSIRAETYLGLTDYLMQRGERENLNIGRMIILPSTFIGSPRSQLQRFQDALAIVQNNGMPSLFITVTCNPNWPEIKAFIPPNAVAANYPLEVARVFKMKLNSIMDEILKDQIFGKVRAAMWVIEFQKRGLPHAHMTLIMEDDDRFLEPERIDFFVSAELPNRQREPELYELVKKHMIHGPCGKINPNSPCMENGRCSKHFPKPYQNYTEISDDGFVIYRRRNLDSRSFIVNSKALLAYAKVTNQYVVPYNAYLLKRYNCHINVEVTANMRSTKYLYKYLYKGSDMAVLKITECEQRILNPHRPITQQDNENLWGNDANEQRNNDPDINMMDLNDGLDNLLNQIADEHEYPHRQKRKGRIDYDEISAYRDTRYISPPEAAWRILAYPLHDSTHTVMRLPVHLPDHQNVQFHYDANDVQIQQVLQNNRITQLTAWFTLNETDEHARQLHYNEIPNDYVWITNPKRWKRRQRIKKPVVVRLYITSPRQMELFHLRLLLLHVKGATSYESLRTVGGVTYATYREACEKLHLIDNDDEWRSALMEASARQMPKQLRQFFAMLLCFCTIHNARALFDEFHYELTLDFTRKNMSPQQAEQRALNHISYILTMNNVDIKQFNLPEITHEEPDPKNAYNEQDETDFAQRCVQSLNENQRQIYNLIINAVETNIARRNNNQINNNYDRLFYLSGAGGTGKSFLYNTIISTLRGRGIKCIAIAFTGIASEILKGGKTVHTTFKLPLNIDEKSTSSIKINSKLADEIRQVECIIWDEVTMVTKDMLNAVDRTLQFLCHTSLPFGGKVVVLGGDFRQCLPIITGISNKEKIIVNCITSSTIWHEFRHLKLTQNMRTLPEEADFAKWLLNLGNNQLPFVQVNPYNKSVEIPEQCVIDNPNEMIIKCFGEPPYENGHAPLNCAIIAFHNENCAIHNNLMLQKIPGEVKEYLSADTIIPEGNEVVDAYADNIPIEYLNSLNLSGVPPHKLHLKVGATVMLLRNLNLRKNLCNGTRLKVRDLHDNYIEAEKISSEGEVTDEVVFIPRIDFHPDHTDLPFRLKRRQFPLTLAYAITANKAQGQTFNKIGIDLSRPVFAHGQLYVAFSRARSLNNVTVYMPNNQITQGRINQNRPEKYYAYNIVYPEILHNMDD